MRAADAHKLPAGGALAVDRHGFSAAVHGRPARPSAGRASARGGGGPAARRLGQRHRRDRAADLAGAGRGDPHAVRARMRSPSSTPSRPSCTTRASTCRSPGSSRATTKAGPAGDGADYLNCPLHQAGVRGLRRRPCSRPTRPSSRSGRQHALLRRLPADRGDRAERGRETLRYGPMKPVGLADPRTGRQALCRGAAAPGQRARHAVQHGRASRPS